MSEEVLGDWKMKRHTCRGFTLSDYCGRHRQNDGRIGNVFYWRYWHKDNKPRVGACIKGDKWRLKKI
jgi:hypothetical protein